jgi:hypothetical protein
MVALVGNLLVPKTIDIGATADGQQFTLNRPLYTLAAFFPIIRSCGHAS